MNNHDENLTITRPCEMLNHEDDRPMSRRAADDTRRAAEYDAERRREADAEYFAAHGTFVREW